MDQQSVGLERPTLILCWRELDINYVQNKTMMLVSAIAKLVLELSPLRIANGKNTANCEKHCENIANFYCIIIEVLFVRL